MHNLAVYFFKSTFLNDLVQNAIEETIIIRNPIKRGSTASCWFSNYLVENYFSARTSSNSSKRAIDEQVQAASNKQQRTCKLIKQLSAERHKRERTEP